MNTEGLKPDPERVRAIVEMPRPEGRDNILRLNGMVNYLSRFLPNLYDHVHEASPMSYPQRCGMVLG